MKQMKTRILELSGRLALLLLASLAGGGAMAAAALGKHGADEDPNEGGALEGSTPDDLNMGIQQSGGGSTGSAVEEAELDNAQVEEYIMQYQAWKYPLHTDFLSLARKNPVRTKKPKHPVMGEAVLEAYTKEKVGQDEPEGDNIVELKLYGNDAGIFPEKSTIRVFGKTGYDADGKPNNAPLMLYVMENYRGTAVKVTAINGPLRENGETYVPEIPKGTKLRVMASALSESELRVPADNFMPGWKQAYLQKKACAVTRTDFYERIKKYVKFGGQMVKDATLSNFRKKCTSTLLFGAPGMINKYDPVTGTYEHCYFQEGVIPQLPNSYQLSGLPTIADLIAISRMAFTKYSRTNIAQVYCGDLFMEYLANIDFSRHPEIQFTTQRDNLKVKVSRFETNFGTLEFKLDYALSENGLADSAILIPMSEAIRYIYEEKTVDHDHKNDTEARDARSEYYIVDDCLMLTGLTAMFISPDTSIIGVRTDSYGTKFVSVDKLPAESQDKDVVYYLTCEDGEHAVGPYRWADEKWEAWEGRVVA